MASPGLRGSCFDGAVLAANLGLVPPLSAAMSAGGPLAGALLVSAWAALTAGAWLKRVPLQRRLAERAAVEAGRPPSRLERAAPIVSFVLLVMLWGLGCALFLAGGEEWTAASGDRELASRFTLAGAALGWLPAAFFATALVPPRAGRTAAWRDRPAAELSADLLLGFGVVVSLGLWESAFVPQLAAIEPASWPLGLLAVLLLTVPFAIFYFAPRLLFLAEDYRSPRAWLSAALAMAPLAWRIVR